MICRYVSSWIDTREVQSERANLTILFDKYIPPCLTLKFKKITPIGDNSHLQMLCYLLECLLTPENTPPDCPKEWYELYFVFACIWAFGGCLFQDQVITLRAKLSGEVYCYRSCLWRAGGVCLWVCLWVCYHDNSKLRASIFIKVGL